MTASDMLPVTSSTTGTGDPLYDVEIRHDIRIPTADPAVSLSGDLFLPVDAGIVPALVTVLPYRKDVGAGILYGESLRWFAARGYASLLVDFRGTGSSGGGQRPPLDADEADDGVAAVEWAAAQHWCNGKVGMIGQSYGAVMAMRTATRRPPHLKAILPVMGLTDPEVEFVHPAGSRGGLASLARWGCETLLNQLLPPLHAYGTDTEQQRWRERLHGAQPWIADLLQHGPGDPAWRSRAFDATSIAVPSFCVAGWRDLFCEASIRAFEQIDGPKKLLVGPWMHTMPEASPFDPVDLRVLALRWWDHWLNGIDTGLMQEAPVSVYVQGPSPEWRQFDSWPPASENKHLATVDDLMLQASANPSAGSASATHAIAEWTPDPTAGALSGLWAFPTAGFGLPQDQHDDDLRSAGCTSHTLDRALVIGGYPIVMVTLAPDAAATRLVVRLVDVDAAGRSTLITTGMVTSPEPTDGYTVTLAPTAYTVAAGHRLRVVIDDADFPRVWPTASPDTNPSHLVLHRVTLSLPAVPENLGTPVTLPAPTTSVVPPGVHLQPIWTICRDLANDGVDVTFGHELLAKSPNGQHALEIRHAVSASVRRATPAAATMHGRSKATVHMSTGEVIRARADIDLTSTTAAVIGEVTIDGNTIFSRRWEATSADAGTDR